MGQDITMTGFQIVPEFYKVIAQGGKSLIRKTSLIIASMAGFELDSACSVPLAHKSTREDRYSS